MTQIIKYRPDIDGLRGLAIILVLVFHIFPSSLTTGYIGVDIFFVISGYLITSIVWSLLSGQNFSLLNFYDRRIRRIFPALIVMLFMCLCVGLVVLVSPELTLLAKHVFSSSVYITNFTLMHESGYFDTNSDLKPLMHLWSLAIEEQFYFVWPLILIICRRYRLNPLIVTIALMLTSFGLNIFYLGTDLTFTFYSPFTRVWEILAGGFLYFLSLRNLNLNQITRHSSAIGLALITFALFFLKKKSEFFPGYLALLPTLGAMLILIGDGDSWVNRKFLSSRFMVSIGLISYPLYLVHWPLISFVYILEGGDASQALRYSVLVLSFLLAWSIYRLIEQPLKELKLKKISMGLLSFLFLLGGVGFLIENKNGLPARYPAIEKNVDRIGANLWKEKGFIFNESCIIQHAPAFKSTSGVYCLQSDLTKSPTIALIGDSHSNSLFPGFSKAYLKKGENVLNVGRGGCPGLLGLQRIEPGKAEICNESTKMLFQYVLALKNIRTVILADNHPAYITGENFGIAKTKDQMHIRYDDDPSLKDPAEIYKIALFETIKKIEAAGKTVIVVSSIPELGFNPESCVNMRPVVIKEKLLKKPCSLPLAEFLARQRNYLPINIEIKKYYPHVTILEPNSVLCSDESCSAVQNENILYRDESHLNQFGSEYVVQKLLP